MDKEQRHILTGNLSIVKNNKLRKFFTKDPKYQQNKTIYWKKARASIITSLEDCLYTWYIKNSEPKSNLL